MKTLLKNLTLLFLILCAGGLSAQSFYKERMSRDNVLSVGFGPSFAYLDNGGPYKALEFEIEPSISIALTRRLNPTFDIRSTVGFQNISSGRNANGYVQEEWTRRSSAFSAKGSVYYFDLMPSMNLFSFDHHMNRRFFNMYGGLGIGVLHAATEQTKSYESAETPTDHKITTGYVPLRAGMSFKLGPYSDIAGEGTILWTFSDNLDGNEDFNKFGDHLFQAQIVFRHYFKM